MKPLPLFRISRISLAAVFFVLIFSAAWFWEFSRPVLKTQIGSAALDPARNWPLLLGAVLLTLIFGRFYCSLLCPLGILQDLMMAGRGKFAPQPRYTVLRLAVFAGVLALGFAGVLLPLVFLLPSAGFFLIENHVFRRVFQAGIERSGFHIPIQAVNGTVTALVAAWVLFFALLLLARWRGRIYCNTVCPVGAVLAVPAKFSWFKITLKSNCVSCGACERACKSGCIDAKAKTVNSANCVMCLNCLDRCKFKAISFGHASAPKGEFSIGRRKFLEAGGIIAGSAAGAFALAKGGLAVKHAPQIEPVMPPGAGTAEEFHAKCTGCGLCIADCSGSVLTPATLQYGLGGILKPHLDFRRGACDFNCTYCSHICPCGALKPVEPEEKKRLRIGLAKYERSICVSYTDGTDCGACAEHCPVGALTMEPFGETTLPKVNEALCIGCGACQNICPVRPVTAMVVHGVREQRLMAKPKPTESKKLSAEEDFPF